MNPEDEIDAIPADEEIDAIPAPDLVPAGPKPSTAEANAAWAERQGPAERAQLLATALDPSATPEARERARTLTRALLERHAAQAIGTADTAAPIVGRDERPTAGITGAAQGLTLGWADELGGAMRSQATGRTYEQERDEIRRSYAGAREQAPTATSMGELAGSTPYMLIPGAGQTAPLRIATQAGIGMGLGTASGAGYSEGETRGEVLEDAALGGALGGLMGGGGQALSEGGGLALDAARRTAAQADRARIAAIVPGRGGQIHERVISGAERLPGGIEGAAESLRRQGITGPMSNADDVVRQAEAAIQRLDDDILSPMYDHLDEVARVPRDRLLEHIDRVGDRFDASPDVAADRIAEYVRGITDRARSEVTPRRIPLRAGPRVPEEISYRQARDLIEPIRTAANFAGPESRAAAQVGARDAYRAARESLDEIAEEAMRPGIGADAAREAVEQFQRARRDRVIAEYARRMAEETGNRIQARGLFGLRDYMAAQGAESAAGGMVRASLSRLWNNRETSIRATSAEVLRALLERNPAALGRWAGPLQRAAAQGGSALAAAHMTLSSRDPEYRRAIEQASEAASDAGPQE